MGSIIEEPPTTEVATEKDPEVSFHALSGEYNPKTLRLKGYYLGHMLNILVDSSTTFNFMKPELVHSLQLSSDAINPFRVYVGSGDFIYCNTISRNVIIMVQGVSFEMDIHHLDIASADLVSGMAWLQRLRRVLIDYNRLSMEFFYNNKMVTLQAEQLLQGNPLKKGTIQKLFLQDHIFSLCHLFILEHDSALVKTNLTLEIHQLCQQFASVFGEPQTSSRA